MSRLFTLTQFAIVASEGLPHFYHRQLFINLAYITKMVWLLRRCRRENELAVLFSLASLLYNYWTPHQTRVDRVALNGLYWLAGYTCLELGNIKSEKILIV